MQRNARDCLACLHPSLSVPNTLGKQFVECHFHQSQKVSLVVCSTLLANHDVTRLLDECMTPAQKVELDEAEAVCRRFMAWNLMDFDVDANAARGGVKAKLAEVLGRGLNEDNGDDD